MQAYVSVGYDVAVLAGLAFSVALLSCQTDLNEWRIGEVRRLVGVGRTTVPLFLSMQGFQRMLDASRAKVNGDKSATPSPTTYVNVAVGTRVGLLAKATGRYGKTDIPFYKVKVQTGPRKGLVCYALYAYPERVFADDEVLTVSNTSIAYGAFDPMTLAQFMDARSVGDDALCRGLLALERVIPLPRGTRLTVEDNDPEAIEAFVLIRVASGPSRRKVLYIERDYVKPYYPKGR